MSVFLTGARHLFAEHAFLAFLDALQDVDLLQKHTVIALPGAGEEKGGQGDESAGSEPDEQPDGGEHDSGILALDGNFKLDVVAGGTARPQILICARWRR